MSVQPDLAFIALPTAARYSGSSEEGACPLMYRFLALRLVASVPYVLGIAAAIIEIEATASQVKSRSVPVRVHAALP